MTNYFYLILNYSCKKIIVESVKKMDIYDQSDEDIQIQAQRAYRAIYNFQVNRPGSITTATFNCNYKIDR